MDVQRREQQRASLGTPLWMGRKAKTVTPALWLF